MFSSSGPKGVLTKTRILDFATFLWGHFLTRQEHTHTHTGSIPTQSTAG